MKKILESVDLPDGSGRVVLFECAGVPDFKGAVKSEENLICYEADGRVRWRAQLPDGHLGDCFVAVRLDGDLVLANSWSANALWIDPATGETLKSMFTK